MKTISKDLILFKSYEMDNNSALLINNNECVLIDPSFNSDEILGYLKNNPNLKLIAIILTHAHFDHCFDTYKIINQYPVLVYLHGNDKSTYEKYNLSEWCNKPWNNFDKAIKYFNSNELKINNFKFKIILTPGHTTGSITVLYNNYAFVGDTLFYNSLGRSDFPNSNEFDIIESIKYLYKVLDDSTLIITGHGPCAPLSEIKQVNYIVNSLLK